jgi:polar amino acid transport system substrate-binding protein
LGVLKIEDQSMSLRSIFAAFAALAAVAVSAPSQAQQTLKVGTNTNGAPWSFHDAKSNTEQGISVELIAAIAKDAGFQIQLVPMGLAELIPPSTTTRPTSSPQIC